MKKQKCILTTLAILIILLASFLYSWTHTSYNEIMKLQPGMSYEQVIKIAGKPDDDVGSGIIHLVYNIEDHRTAHLYIYDSEYGLAVLTIEDQTGNRTIIFDAIQKR